jgi:signal transduction histidine kinase
MENVSFLLKIAAVTLLLAQAAITFGRMASCGQKTEALCLAGFCLFLSAMLVVREDSYLHDILTVLVLWTAGAFLLHVKKGRTAPGWSAACMVFMLVLALAWLLGYRETVPFTAFRAFGMAALSAVPLVTLHEMRKGARSSLFIATIGACWLWLFAGTTELVLRRLLLPSLDLQVWCLLLLAGCTAALVFQEGYPLRPGWQGRLHGLEGREQLMRSMYSRLLASESALAQQDRLVAFGVLALGAAHEFKNTLSLIKASAQFGLGCADPEMKDRSLRLLLEHADVGRESAVNLLEKISLGGREESRLLDAAADLSGFFRTVRAAFRGEGILLEVDLAVGVRFNARVSEVEQMLLNLVRNAVQAYRMKKERERGVIRVTARRTADMAVLEVRDAAGGVTAEASQHLFSGSSGLGLYLSRSLALQNGGTLEYRPADDGSIFVLAFPAEEVDDL